jgi:hypothetical protein
MGSQMATERSILQTTGHFEKNAGLRELAQKKQVQRLGQALM